MVKDYPDYWFAAQVRYGEAGPDARARLSVVADWFQEAAGLNADELGFGNELVSRHGLAWVLTRLILYIDRLPAAGEQVRVHTWPARLEHLAHRGYELLDAANVPLVRATGAWAVMDLDTRRIMPMPDELVAAFPTRTLEYVPFSVRVLPRVRVAAEQAEIRVRRDDLDMNGHVNNARYLGWLLEALPARTPTLLDVQFRAECLPGETLVSLCSAPAPVDGAAGLERVHAIVRAGADGETQVCRAISRWRLESSNKEQEHV